MAEEAMKAGEETPRLETRSFGAEVERLLSIMVHSVYSDRDLFLRELISNAADACEKLRTLALADETLAPLASGFKVTLAADGGKRRLTVEDNGIGMDKGELADNLGTIARSGTKAFLDNLGEDKGSAALIGQFGVGFYSAFMVADTVEVVSRRAGSAEAWRWRSDGKGSYTIAPAALEEAPDHGTRVVLDLTEDAADYASPETIERIVAAHSSHVPVPIVLKTGGDLAEKELGDGSALWRKPKSEVSEADYAELYHHVGGLFDEPAFTIHYRAEGRTEYSVLLFVPAMKPFDLFEADRRGKVKLYVRRVFITDEAAILPAWLRFVRGVVDSEDLPLNISRELLQKNPLLEAIGRGVTTRVLTELEKLATDDKPRFEAIWENFGPVIKEGLYESPDRRDALFSIVRFRTTKGDGWRSLADYVAAMGDGEKKIFYAVGESEAAIKASPHLEGFVKRGIEVLLLSDPVDAFWVGTALGFDGRSFQSVTQGAAELPPIEDGGEAAPDAAVATLAARFKQALGERVKEVRSSARLAESAVCLVAADMGLDRGLERMLARAKPGQGRTAPILEINPRHGLIKALAAKATSGGDGGLLDDAAVLLYGQARILEGETPEEPGDYAARLDRLIERMIG